MGNRIYTPGVSGWEKAPEGFRVIKRKGVHTESVGQPKTGRDGTAEPGASLRERGSKGASGVGGYKLKRSEDAGSKPSNQTFKLYSASGQPLRSPGGTESNTCETRILGADGRAAERTPYVTAQDIQAYNERQKSRQKVPPYRRITELTSYSRVLAYMHVDQQIPEFNHLAALSEIEALQIRPLVEYNAQALRDSEATTQDSQS